MAVPLRVLILEDRATDAELVIHELRRAGFEPEWQRVENETDYLALLDKDLDLILADYSLPQWNALRALQLLLEQDLDVPFIVVTGAIGDEAAAQIVREGASDYLLKDRLARLGQAVRQALEEKQLRIEKQQAEMELREKVLQLQGILDTIQEGVLLLSTEGYVILANPKAHQFLTALSDMGEDGVISHLGGNPLQEFFKARQDNLPYEIELEGPPRRIFEIYVNPAYVNLKGGAWTLLIRDVTEARFAQTKAQLQDRLAAVGQLAAGIAHDFNNILGTITLLTELLRKTQELSPKNRERAKIINQQAHHAASLIGQILDFSRRSVVERHPIDMVPFLKEIIKLLKRTLPSNIHITLLLEEEQIAVNADPTRMQQLFTNLALNARDAMPDGGELQFELAPLEVEPGKPPPFRDMSPGHWVRICVSDMGKGIPPEILPHIFEPFVTTKLPGEGTGLGLAQVYGIVKQHEGYIDVKSQPGEGATFIIYLPMLREPAVSEPSIDIVLEEMGRGETILVVDDDETTRQALGEMLEELNYQVHLAADGKEALAYLEQSDQPVDLVISDIMMPTIDGIALYKKILESFPETAMILITGYPLDEETRHLLEEGTVKWIQKPLSSSILARTIGKVLRQKV